MVKTIWILIVLVLPVCAQDTLTARARKYLVDLIRLDSSNPPGNETRVARYLKRVADAEGIPSELIGGDPARLNFLARLEGSGTERPLLLMAHSDVVPVERSQWTVDPFTAEMRDGYIHGRGAQDTKGLLAAELSVLVELKRRGVRPRRTVILLVEADEEADSSGIQWLIANAWKKIDAEFAINEGGFALDTLSAQRVFHIQTSEKIPSRVILTARGTAGHGSLPRADNPVVRLARAISRLADADQPVRLNTTTRRYLREIAKLPDYKWLIPHLPRLENGAGATAVAGEIRKQDTELDAQLRTSLSPTMLAAGVKINVIPNVAEAQVDVRRMPDETREEVTARLRKIIADPAVEVKAAPGQTMPATEPSALTTPLYLAMERVFRNTSPRSVVVPYMSRGRSCHRKSRPSTY
ncbi:MAG: M20/M25/M40 family metallo-hydrolase, partial [Gemmatimonadetes bacterium]|nr:M20/M25/M40 family metallo-hydrolase [Gemmatimonadota bacterium]